MTDEKDDTYWTTDDGTKTGEILIDLGEKKNFDVVSIEEAIQNGQRINDYKVEYREGTEGEWILLEKGQRLVQNVFAERVKLLHVKLRLQ